MKKLLLICLLFLSGWAQAQQVRPLDAAGLYHEIAQLNNLTRVLYLAAHPDDENTRLLGWLVNHKHIPTAYLSLTRGDGGQNILGSELGPALGLIRTYELLEARKMDGAGQFFTRAVDFGFSKNYQETFTHWNQDTILKDVVWIIRKYRPDVIICRFPPNELAGHGHHAASAVLAAKAFKAAGDPTQFPEQLAFYKPWKPKRLLWNTYRFGNRNTTSEDQLKIQVGHYSPLIGMGYGELAGKSRSIHRSQGAGTPSVAGTATEYFQHVAGDAAGQSLFDGIDISWNRIGRPDIGEMISAIMERYDFKKPYRILPDLLALRAQLQTVTHRFWRTEKLKALDQIILNASGFMAEAVTESQEAVIGDTLPYKLNLISRTGKIKLSIEKIQWPDGSMQKPQLRLYSDSLYSLSHTFVVPGNTPLTQPYWLASPTEDNAHYIVPNMQVAGLPNNPHALSVSLVIKLDTHTLQLHVPLSWKNLDPIRGDMIEQLRVIPALSLDFIAPVTFVKQDGSIEASVQVRAERTMNDANLTIKAGSYTHVIPHLHFRKSTDTVISFRISPAEVQKIGNDVTHITASIQAGENVFYQKRNMIRYDHIPTLQFFTEAKTSLVPRNWKTTAKKIAYVPGAGDQIAEILQAAGIQVTILQPEQIDRASKLQQYDAVVLGIRALNTQKELIYRMPVLLDYVYQGGTLMVQYNNYRQMPEVSPGPYPMEISGKRVTEETAPVTFLRPQHKLMKHPNLITQKDFDGWVQERGLYFPDQWDAQYETLFSMSDTGEDPLEGSVLYAPYGKGHYIYTGLAFFRQLPAGNVGAFRLFMNMISAGK